MLLNKAEISLPENNSIDGKIIINLTNREIMGTIEGISGLFDLV